MKLALRYEELETGRVVFVVPRCRLEITTPGHSVLLEGVDCQIGFSDPLVMCGILERGIGEINTPSMALFMSMELEQVEKMQLSIEQSKTGDPRSLDTFTLTLDVNGMPMRMTGFLAST